MLLRNAFSHERAVMNLYAESKASRGRGDNYIGMSSLATSKKDAMITST